MERRAINTSVLSGRYVLRDILRQGDGAISWLASTRDEQRVVIKEVAHRVLPVRLRERVRFEAAALGECSTPRGPLVLECRSDGDALLLVRPYQPLPPLWERLQRGPLPLPRAVGLASALARVLTRVHRCGVVHRNLKPSNIFVGPAHADEPVATADLLLCPVDLLHGARHPMVADLVRYLSPEQAGAVRRPVGPGSDLYVLGLVLYECLCGTPLHGGQQAGEILQQQLDERPPSLRQLGLAAPRSLEEVLDRLLRVEPDERYQNADALAMDLAAIEEALSRGGGAPLAIGRTDRRTSLVEPVFVGRQRELQRVEQAVVRARLGEGGLVLVTGAPAQGKTAVLDELARRVSARGLWLLRGNAVDRPDASPYQLLEGIVDGVLQRAADDGDLAPRLRQRLGAALPQLLRALPRLAPLAPGVPPVGAGGSSADPRQRMTWVGQFLAALGSPQQCAVVLLDDVHWSEPALIRGLSSLDSAGPVHTTVILSCSSDAEAPRQCVEQISPQLRLELPPLEASEVRQLLESMAGRLPEEVHAEVLGSCEGNPFLAAATLWGMVDSEALVADADGWTLARRAARWVGSSWRSGSMLVRRLESLGEPTLDLLRAAAVLGAEVSVEELVQVSGLPPAELADRLAEARRRHLVLMDPAGRRLRLPHRAVRERLMALTDAGTLERLHLRAGEAVLARDDSARAMFAVSHHLDAAGRSEQALPYALAAAEQALDQGALNIAQRQLAIASRGAAGADRATRRHIAATQARVLLSLHRHAEARGQLLRALKLSERPEERADCLRQLGLLCLRQGDPTAAVEALTRGLEQLGRRAPAGGAELALALGQELLGRIVPRAVARSRAGGDQSLQRQLLTLHAQLPEVLWHQRGLAQVVWSHLYRWNRAEQVGDPATIHVARSFHARLLALLGQHGRAAEQLERLQLSPVAGGAAIEGYVALNRAVVHYVAARFELAVRHATSAAEHLARGGEPWLQLEAQGVLARCALRQGELRCGAELGRVLFEQACEQDQALPAAQGLVVWAIASGGRIPAEPVQGELSRAEGDTQRWCTLAQAEAVRLLRAEQPEAASLLLQRAWGEGRRVDPWADQLGPLAAWLLTAWRCWLERMPAGAAERRRLLQRARRLARRARLLARWFPVDAPHLLRERGLLAALDLQLHQARRELERSLTVAQQQGARYERAQTLWASARVGRAVGWRGARQRRERARRELAELDVDVALGGVVTAEGARASERVAASVSLVDRFDQLLRAGRRIATALSRDAVLQASCEAAARLLRGQHCLVVALGADDPGPHIVAGAPHIVLSRTLVRRALAQGGPVAASVDAAVGPAPLSASVVLSGMRSVLVAPIPRRDGERICLYVTHGRVGGLYGEEERGIASFIASVAGAALDNADSYGELEGAFAALRRAHEELKSTQTQLVQAGRLAVLGQLGAGIAHELNQPIQSIQGFAQRILRHQQAQVAHHADELEIIVRASRRMASIVTNVGKFARGGAAQREVIEPLHPLREALQLCRHQLERDGIEVDWEPAAELPSIEGNAGELEQVFLNLLQNARDAMVQAAGGPRAITLGVTVADEMVRISVADTGCGISPELQERIFDPFFTTKEPGQGQGLGLSISHGIIQQHGGVLRCGQSEAGAIFIVELPAVKGIEHGSQTKRPVA